MKPLFATAALLACLATAAAAADFKVTSAEVRPGSTIDAKNVYNAFGCTGANVSPSLQWSGAPVGTKGYAVTVLDPDAPGKGWWHWVVINLPATVGGLAAGAGSADGTRLPAGAVQTMTDFGSPGYGGPCPPPGSGPHRYIFSVYALKTDRLDLSKDTGGEQAETVIKAHALARAWFIAKYGR